MLLFSVFYTNAQNDTLKVSPVYINATFVSKNYLQEQIDTVLLKNNSTAQLSNLLQLSSPVFIKSFGNNGVSTASFRGTSASHTQVFWNDISLNSPMIGQTDFSLVPVFFTDKINISAGSRSLSQSEGALGGSIMLNTNPDWTTPISFTVGQNIASFKDYSTFLKFSTSNKKILFDSRIIRKTGVNNFTYFNNALPGENWQELQNANFYQISFLQQLYFRINPKSVLSVHLWHTNSTRNIPPIMSFEGLYRCENQIDERDIVSLKFLSYFGKIHLKINLSYSKNKLHYFLADSTLNFPENTLIVKSNSNSSEQNLINSVKLRFSLSEKIKIEAHVKSSLFNVSTYDSATYSMIGYEKQRNQTNSTLIFNYYPIKSVKTYFIISETMVDLMFLSPSFSTGLSNELIKNRKLVWGINAGKNQHLPSLNDLFWQPGGNPDLKPESGYSSDVFISSLLIKNKFNFDVTINPFVAIINDWIIWQPSEFQYWTAQNIKTVFSRGVDINLKIFKQGRVSYKFIANYALTITTDESTNDNFSTGKQLIYTPKNTANLFLFISFMKFEYNVSLNFIDKRFTNSSNNSYVLPAFWLVNSTISKDIIFKKFSFKLNFGVNNIFAIQYQAILFRPMAGRNFMLKISLNL